MEYLNTIQYYLKESKRILAIVGIKKSSSPYVNIYSAPVRTNDINAFVYSD